MSEKTKLMTAMNLLAEPWKASIPRRSRLFDLKTKSFVLERMEAQARELSPVEKARLKLKQRKG